MRDVIVAALAVAILGWTQTAADTIHVPADQPTIQAGINAADSGDTVLVADGVYSGPGNHNLDFGGKLIVVRSAGGAQNCIIDCAGSGRGFFFNSGETAEAVVEGFTIQNGNVIWSHPGTGKGGAIFCEGSAPTITDCVIRWNQAEEDGGGIYCNWGASAVISNSTITDNLAGDYGGGVCLYNSSDATIAGCIVSDNQAIAGSGIASFACSPMVTNCAIMDNASSGAG